MGPVDPIDATIQFIREQDTVMTEPEILKLARALQGHTALHNTGGVLQVANDLIRGDRLKHYGHPSVNFERIAQSWTQFLSTKQGEAITPTDVCVMMILLKAQRMAEGYHRDSVIDIGGYAALAAILEGDDEL